MMQRILVAVDFSEPSRRALRSALELARAFTASVHVVHVVSSRVYGLEYAQMLSVLGPGALELVAELKDFVLAELKEPSGESVPLDYRVLEGHEPTEILAEAGRCGADLLVIGCHGKSAVERLLLGSVSSSVLGRSRLPVLLVHEASLERPQRILAAIDGHPLTADVLRGAQGWASALDAELGVVHVMPELGDPTLSRIYPESDLRPAMRALLEHVRQDVDAAVRRALPERKDVSLEYRVGTPCREICAHAVEFGYDLVVVGAHQKHALLDLGNTAARVAQRCACSVLVVRPIAEIGALDLSDEAI